jgi:hypothetical protein
VKCSWTDCEHGFHSFKRVRPNKESYRSEWCVKCGTRISDIDWKRLDRRNISDVDYTISALKYEYIRYYFWEEAHIDKRALNHVLRLGLNALRPNIVKRLEGSIGKPSVELFRDGMQTPLQGNVIYYAQHGTACCCRKCMEEWHGIDHNRSLKDNEIDYFTELVLTYVNKKLPHLAANGIFVPRTVHERSKI